MRKVLFCLLAGAMLFSCGKADESVVEQQQYTERQEKVFDVLQGSFQCVVTAVGIEMKGDILTFNKRYDKPMTVYAESYMDGKQPAFVAHGDGRCEDGSLSYDFYYAVSEYGGGLDIYKKNGKRSISERPYKGCVLTITDRDNFIISYDSALPGGGIDRYRRIK